jgi:WD40-like Beta Propeller Repeat
VDNNARVRDGYVDRLLAHPRLPLVAGLEADRPMVHVWDCGAGTPRELAVVGSEAYDREQWDWENQIPDFAWHPHEARLVMTGAAELRQWTADGLSLVDAPPNGPPYCYVAFSPDGRTVWAVATTPFDASHALDIAAGTRRTTLAWDTGIAEHPGGGLVVTYNSSQGATQGLFARPSDEHGLRVYRRALILDADGYETPVFSPDGRFLAIRGNAYGQSLSVFEFASLRRALTTWLVEPSPGFPPPPDWRERLKSWSRNNIAFARRPGVLLIGTPRGTVVEVDLDGHRAEERPVVDGAVGSLAVLATGALVVASRTGDLVLVSALGDPAPKHIGDGELAQRLVAEFVASTTELAEDANLDRDLVLTDGTKIWDPEALTTVTTAEPTDPGWLQIQAFMNAARDPQA